MIPLAALYLSAFAYAAVSVGGVGLALLALGRRAGVLATATPATHLLAAAALALYWAALVVGALVATGLPLAPLVAEAKLALDALLLALAAAAARRELAALARDLAGAPLLLGLAALGAVYGSWAFLQFPHVLDSGQLAWTQRFLVEGRADGPSPAHGFAGLIGFFGARFPELPLATSAAALKPLLGAVAAAVAWHAADSLAPARRGLAAALVLALMVLSDFGLRGIVFLGKDSIYGVLFSVAFMATLCRAEPSRHAGELGLFFAAAATAGVIALTYMTAAYAIWLAVAPRAERAWSTLGPLYLWTLPVLPSVLAGFAQASLLWVSLAYAAAGLAGFALARLAGARAAALVAPAAPALAALRRWRAALPAALAVPCLFLLPIDLPIASWRELDGALHVVRLPPIDGQTGLVDYLMRGAQYQQYTIWAGLAAALALPLTALGRARAGLVAVCAMPFAVFVAALAPAHFGISPFTNFNIWDIVKDIPLWYCGALLSALTVALLAALAALVPGARAGAAALAAAGGALLAATASTVWTHPYAAPVHFTAAGGHADRDLAETGALAWREFRGRTVYFDQTALWPVTFYLGTWFRAPPVTRALLDQRFAPGERIGVFVRIGLIPEIRAFAAARGASVRQLADVQRGEGVLLAIEFDGRGRVELAERAGATPVAGAHGTEQYDGRAFRWLGATAEIAVSASHAAAVCVTLELFSAGFGGARQLVAIEAPGVPAREIDLAGTSMAAPRRVKVAVPVPGGTARLAIRARFPEGRFPGDARRVALGLRVPIPAEAEARCE